MGRGDRIGLPKGAHYNSADALVHYEDEHQGTTGTFYARGDHWLENGEDDKWYPVTTDTLH